MRLPALLASAALVACQSPAYVEATAHQAMFGATGTSSGDPPALPTTSTNDDAGTSSTTADETTFPGSTATSEPTNRQPRVFSFTAEPGEISAAGPITLELSASTDVTEVDLWYRGELLATLAPDAFPYTFEVTSQSVCHLDQTFLVTVRDAEGLTADATAPLRCELPMSGSEVYKRTFPGAVGSSGASVAQLPDGGVVVAGVLDGHAALWRLDAAGNLLPDWPKSLKDWTANPDLPAAQSYATSVATDANGAIALAAVVKKGLQLRRYVARFNVEGLLVWEDIGDKIGEELTGIAINAKGVILAVGSICTNPLDPEPAYDGGAWFFPPGYPFEGEIYVDVFSRPDEDLFPDDLNEYSERHWAVASLPNGRFIVGGERLFHDLDAWPYDRATILQFTEEGMRVGSPWTSQGSKFAHDAALNILVVGSTVWLSGWGRHGLPAEPRQVLLQEFDLEGNVLTFLSEPSPFHTQGQSLSRDREQKLVIAGSITKPGNIDAWIFATPGAGKPLAWSKKLDASGGFDLAAAVSCDAWGYCTWVGTTTLDGVPTLIVQQLNP